MNESIFATYIDGEIILDTPVDWPSGTRIVVAREASRTGLEEADWPNDEAGIARLLASLDAIEPLDFEPGEEAQIDADRREFRQQNVDAMKLHWDKTESLF